MIFDPRVAYFSDRGANVLQVDYRGSTGWGRGYAQALRGEWGRLDVADVAAGIRAAGERGWGDPKRMVPIGGSAGGMTVLLLMAMHPDLCAAGVDRFGVTDLFDLDETTHRFEAHYLRSVVGELPDCRLPVPGALPDQPGGPTHGTPVGPPGNRGQCRSPEPI